jgi:hypothetical protein
MARAFRTRDGALLEEGWLAYMLIRLRIRGRMMGIKVRGIRIEIFRRFQVMVEKGLGLGSELELGTVHC